MKTSTLIVAVTSTLGLTLLAGWAAAVDLSVTTNLNTGTDIVTTGGTFAENSSNPYVYYIDNLPVPTTQDTLVDFNLAGNDLTNDGDSTQSVQIHAANVSSGGGGIVAFARNGDGVAGFDLQATGTINLPSVTVTTTMNSVNADSGPITLAGTSVVITDVATTPNFGTANEGVGVAKPITITASTGDVILGDVKAGGQRGGGNVSITAAGVIDADTIEAWAGGVNYFSGTVTLSAGGGDITVDDIITGLGGGKAKPITINAPSGNVILDAIKGGGWRQGSDITITPPGSSRSSIALRPLPLNLEESITRRQDQADRQRRRHHDRWRLGHPSRQRLYQRYCHQRSCRQCGHRRLCEHRFHKRLGADYDHG